MLKKRTKVQKRLAKVVMAALLCTNAAQTVWVPAVAEATEITLTDSNCNSLTQTVPVGGAAISWLVTYPYDSAVTTVNAEFTDSLSASSTLTGGYSTNTDVQGKTVNFKSGTFNGLMNAGVSGGTSGGTSGDGKPIGNTVNVSGGKASTVFGGLSFYNYVASQSFAEDNTVNISSDAEVGYVYGAYAYGNADIQKNTVNISGGKVTNVVAGGFCKSKNYGSGDANKNTVNITGGTISSTIYGGMSDSGYADNNKVNISGGTISKGTTGYYALIFGGSGKYSASGNTVTIGGDANLSFDTNIVGGAAFYNEEDPPGSGSYVTKKGTAANNTVNILIPMTVTRLYGGDGDTATSTGNTLNLAAKNVNVVVLGGFQNMNFYLPSDIANNDTMLTVADGLAATGVKGVTFGVAALQGVSLQKGDTVNLITSPNGLTTDDTLKTTDSATLAKAEFLSANSLTTDDKYELSISKKDANTIIATVDNVTEQKADEGGNGENGGSGKKAVSIPDVLKSPVETRAGVVTMINAGADLLISQGMSNAADAAAAERTEGDAAAAPKAGGFAPFAAVSFGKLRAESGSHVDNKGIGMNLGFAREIENKNGKLLVGPVIEYGHGSYDSYQDSGIKADGKSSYWGIGVIAKQTNDNGFYYEGSLRAGRTKSDYNSDLRPGLHVNYDSSATYWAAHLGVGKLEDIGHDNTLDYYGKYFYSHTGSDSTYLNGANETANFDAVNSHRIRLGARLTHALNEKNKLYGGLAWQYEFKGDARATYSVSGEAPSPSVKGSSGMIELGWQVKPGKSPMTIDLGVTGWVGKQRGITANLQANWTF